MSSAESLSQSSIMVIANAIYFRGTWQTAFDADRTKEADFCGLPGPGSGTNCVKVEMMETTGSFRSKLISELDATLLELPYDVSPPAPSPEPEPETNDKEVQCFQGHFKDSVAKSCLSGR